MVMRIAFLLRMMRHASDSPCGIALALFMREPFTHVGNQRMNVRVSVIAL